MLSKLLLTLVFTLFTSIYLNAQDTINIENSSKWNYKFGPNILIPYMNGDVTVKGISASVSATPSDILSKLKVGALFNFEMSNPKWTFMFDFLYIGIEHQVNVLTKTGDVGVSQMTILSNGMYKFYPWFEAGAGFFVNTVSASVFSAAGRITPEINVSQKVNWVDPLISMRLSKTFMNDKINSVLYTNFGGFGVGSEITYQINPYIGYRFTKLIELDLGYNWIYIKYMHNNNANDFVYDIGISAFEVRLMFNF